MKNDIITTLQMKLKHLNYLPKPIHIDESRYDLVDDDEFFKRDNRMPLVMVGWVGKVKPLVADESEHSIIIAIPFIA